jgi:broad specificity phosphatase PhoE
VLIIRHGESEANKQKVVAGQLDPPLTALGRQQAEALARHLRQERLDAIVTSSLQRTVLTATPAAHDHGLRIDVRDALKEIHLGALQGRFRDERDPDALCMWKAREVNVPAFRPQGGETFLELERRVQACLRDLLADYAGKTFLVVGHRNTNRVILGALMRVSREESVAFKPKPTVLHAVTLGDVPTLDTIRIAAIAAAER